MTKKKITMKNSRKEILAALTEAGINVVDANNVRKEDLIKMLPEADKKADKPEADKKADKKADKPAKKKAGDFLLEGKELVEKLGYEVKATANDLDNKHRFKVDLGGKNVRFDFSGKTFTVKATVQFTGAEYFEGKAHPYIAKANVDLAYIEEVLASAKASLATIKAKKEADKPEADKPEADKPEADKPEADKPEADKPEADKPEADKPEEA